MICFYVHCKLQLFLHADLKFTFCPQSIEVQHVTTFYFITVIMYPFLLILFCLLSLHKKDKMHFVQGLITLNLCTLVEANFRMTLFPNHR